MDDEFPGAIARDIKSPFTRCFGAEFYDGETSGLLVDAAGNVLTFKMIDWDASQDMRVFRAGFVDRIHESDIIRRLFAGKDPLGARTGLPHPLTRDALEFLEGIRGRATFRGILASENLMKLIKLRDPTIEHGSRVSNESAFACLHEWLECHPPKDRVSLLLKRR